MDAVLKTAVAERLPWVRIPPLPLIKKAWTDHCCPCPMNLSESAIWRKQVAGTGNRTASTRSFGAERALPARPGVVTVAERLLLSVRRLERKVERAPKASRRMKIPAMRPAELPSEEKFAPSLKKAESETKQAGHQHQASGWFGHDTRAVKNLVLGRVGPGEGEGGVGACLNREFAVRIGDVGRGREADTVNLADVELERNAILARGRLVEDDISRVIA